MGLGPVPVRPSSVERRGKSSCGRIRGRSATSIPVLGIGGCWRLSQWMVAVTASALRSRRPDPANVADGEGRLTEPPLTTGPMRRRFGRAIRRIPLHSMVAVVFTRSRVGSGVASAPLRLSGAATFRATRVLTRCVVRRGAAAGRSRPGCSGVMAHPRDSRHIRRQGRGDSDSIPSTNLRTSGGFRGLWRCRAGDLAPVLSPFGVV